MSGINQIRIYYGQGKVVNGPSRADLGHFPHITVDHPHPESASIRDLKDWFMAMFQLDANLCSVTVHCLYITGINPVVYELRVADRTYKWRKWVEWCRRCNVPLTILVQPCLKEVLCEASSSQPVENESACYGDVSVDQLQITEEHETEREQIDVDGLADGGESVEAIVEDLAAVDRNAIHEEENLNMEDEMDDDDEDDDNLGSQAPIPEEWNRPDQSRMEAMDMQKCSYQYGCSMIQPGQLFSNK